MENKNAICQNMKLPFLLGTAANGTEVYKDLTDAVHLLIAGTTGSGKSVFMNALITSLINQSENFKFCIIDPKKVELAFYGNLGPTHFFNEELPATDSVIAAKQLASLCEEMDKRYDLLQKNSIRNIRQAKEKGIQLDYIVCVIDEFADLTMCNPMIEYFIVRLAQLGRACGIHLVIATQRPSAEVIGGLIKANFPTRIAFRTSSHLDSRIILDRNGAENLKGKGDMIWQCNGEVEHLKGKFITDQEIFRIIDQKRKFQTKTETNSSLNEIEVFAAKLFYEYGNISSAFLQRRMKLSYTRANKVIQNLLRNGVLATKDSKYKLGMSYTRFLRLS